MNKNEIKVFIVENKKELNDLMVSQHQIDVINFVKSKKFVFSGDVAEKFSLSIQSASTTLKNLLNKGYLKRDEMTAASGGKEFQWSCAINFTPSKK